MCVFVELRVLNPLESTYSSSAQKIEAPPIPQRRPANRLAAFNLFCRRIRRGRHRQPLAIWGSADQSEGRRRFGSVCVCHCFSLSVILLAPKLSMLLG